MITIKKGSDVVTLINVFSCEPENQQALVDAWVRATEETLGKLPGIISASLHKSKDGTRVVNYAQWKTSENWERLLEMANPHILSRWANLENPTLISMRSAIKSTKPTIRSAEEYASCIVILMIRRGSCCTRLG